MSWGVQPRRVRKSDGPCTQPISFRFTTAILVRFPYQNHILHSKQ
jgi:hypothetical protein